MDGILLQLSNLDATTRWWLIIAVALTIFYAVMRPMRKKKDPLNRSATRGGLAEERAVQRDLTHLLVEMSEMARQVTAQLDTRTLKLEMLIKDADERIAELKSLSAARVEPAGAAPASAAPAAAAPPAAPIAPRAMDARHQDVYELADQRLGAEQIAIRLGRPRGEIELILALRAPAGEARLPEPRHEPRHVEPRHIEPRPAPAGMLRLAQDRPASVDLEASSAKPRRKKKSGEKSPRIADSESLDNPLLRQRGVG